MYTVLTCKVTYLFVVSYLRFIVYVIGPVVIIADYIKPFSEQRYLEWKV